MRTLSSLFLFAVLVIAVAAQTPQQLADQALQQKTTGCTGVTDEQQCHAKYISGCGKTATALYDPYLDFLKDDLPPTASQPADTVDPTKLQQLEAATPAALTEGNHSTFSAEFVKLNEGEIVSTMGYLYYAMSTGAESSNCYITGTANVDFHIGIGFDASRIAEAQSKPATSSSQFLDLQAHSMIVEMTPHYRAQLEPKWALTKLQAAYGMQVKVVGQLMADNDHHSTSDDCAMSGATSSCWRLSIWEIHPVTSFYVCTATGGCPTADSTGWTKLEDWSGTNKIKKHHPKKKMTESPSAS
jgi:hypothetical protein